MTAFLITMAVLWLLKAGAKLGKVDQPGAEVNAAGVFTAFLLQIGLGAWAIWLLLQGGAA